MTLRPGIVMIITNVGSMMFKADQMMERQLFAFSVWDLIPETSDVWLYVDLFDELDLAAAMS